MKNFWTFAILFLVLCGGSPFATAAVHCESSLPVSGGPPNIWPSGRRIQLFVGNKPVANFQQVLNDLKVGDTLVFPNGEKFVIGEVLGEGSINRIFDLGDGWALRVSKIPGAEGFDFMEGYLKTYKDLKNEGVPVADVDLERSSKYAIVVKKINFEMTLAEYFSARETWSEKDQAELEEKLMEFFATTWKFTDITDVNPGQIVYDGDKWILIDYYGYSAPGHFPLRNFSESKPIMHKKKFEDDLGKYSERPLPKDIEKAAKRVVNELRKRYSQLGEWIERSSDRSTDSGELVDRVTKLPLARDFVRTFDKEDFYFSRDLWGFAPRANLVNVSIEKAKGEKDNFSIYKAKINGLTGALKVTIKGDGNSWEEVAKERKRAKAKGIFYFSGSDFIFVYDDDQENRLQPIR